MTKSQERALNNIKRLAEKWANEGFKDGELKWRESGYKPANDLIQVLHQYF